MDIFSALLLRNDIFSDSQPGHKEQRLIKAVVKKFVSPSELEEKVLRIIILVLWILILGQHSDA